MLDRVLAVKPHWFSLSTGMGPLGVTWFMSTVLLTGVGFFMNPTSIATVYSARSEDALRRNAIFLPFYQLILLLVFFAGFTALLIVPGMKSPASDQAFMLVVARYYAPWVLGIVAGAGCLAALVPASGLLLGAASVLSKNVVTDVFGVGKTDAGRTLTTRLLVLVVAALALVFWLFYNKSLVELLLLYYNGISQFMPGFVFALLWRRAGGLAVGTGLFVGITVAVSLAAAGITPWGLNAGFVGLLANVACVAIAAVFKPNERPAAVATGLR